MQFRMLLGFQVKIYHPNLGPDLLHFRHLVAQSTHLSRHSLHWTNAADLHKNNSALHFTLFDLFDSALIPHSMLPALCDFAWLCTALHTLLSLSLHSPLSALFTRSLCIARNLNFALFTLNIVCSVPYTLHCTPHSAPHLILSISLHSSFRILWSHSALCTSSSDHGKSAIKWSMAHGCLMKYNIFLCNLYTHWSSTILGMA